MVIDIGANNSNVPGRATGICRGVGIADGAEGKLVDARSQISGQRDDIGATARNRQSKAFPVSTISTRDGECFLSIGYRCIEGVKNAHHNTFQMAVFIGDRRIGCHNLGGTCPLGIACGIEYPGCTAVGIHHRCPEIVDGGRSADGGRCPSGNGTVGQGYRYRSRSGKGIGVCVQVGDCLDDILIFSQCADTTDGNADGAAACDGDGVTQ